MTPRAPVCLEARRLLDAYMMSLSLEHSVRDAFRCGDVTAVEVNTANQQLKDARSKYWAHVQRHNCREALATSAE